MSARLLAIDPGLSGALAVVDTGCALEIEDLPTVTVDRGGKAKRQIDVAALAADVRRLAPVHAIIERVGARPGQGVSSMFAFGRSVGQVEGVVAALGIPITYVTPQIWRKALSVPAGKDGSRLRASQLLPAYAERWRRAKDDGRAEAALIGLYGLLHLGLLRASAGEAA